jgi:hypothetical protein
MYENKSGGWVETNISDEPNSVYSVAIGDANRDGQNEVVIGLSYTSAGNETRMYQNISGAWVETNISDVTNSVYSIAIEDANNDGQNEVVIGMGSTTNEVRMYSYSPVCSQGTLNSSTSLIETNIKDESVGVYSVAVGDANNDGKNDVVIGMSSTANEIRMYENKSGSWVETVINNSPDTVYSVSVGDANNDGRNDVVIGAGYSNNELRMYENKSGGWIETNISNFSMYVYSTPIGDADNDGKNEIVIGKQNVTPNSYNLRMYKNQSGGWVEKNISDTPDSIDSVAIGDANNDGSNELVIGMAATTNEVRMYKNTTGGWMETNIHDVPQTVWSVAIGDANNDGRNDVVIGMVTTSNEVRMYENKSGGWVETNITNTPTGVYPVVIGDANNDGRNEVVIGIISTTNELRMYENKSGGWIETNISDVPDDVRSATIGDANNDGYNEMVIGMDSTTNELRAYSYATSAVCSVTANVSYAQCNITSSQPSATFSCLIAGGPNATSYSASACNLGSCLTDIATSDDSRANLLNGQNFTMAFSPAKNGSMVELYLEGYHNQSAALTYLYDSAGSQIASYNFSNSADEGHVFDLSDFYPDPNGLYNITVKTNYNASYDYAYLNVSSNVYSPKRIVVQTWNNGD